ncbi:hypothetical protein [Amphritea pacifica]|uniref:hypothetical protein n=1 Tax=Amphritea pacifica TaxID=2811233 RepID=UPI00196467E9|nr:hypothetical protein [Amphritea pacifica]MBN1008780.1 hypothetical protein [Amphritea pacifica]
MEQTLWLPDTGSTASIFSLSNFLRRLCSRQHLYDLSLCAYLPEINTFPFIQYSVIGAVVDNVSSDATADENRGLIYKARLLMNKSTLWVNGREVNLVPGMSVSAEVKTGKRYLIEYVLTPLLRYKNESVRER